MNSLLILQVFTIFISFATLVVNIYLTKYENKKRNFLQYTTKHRVNEIIHLRNIVSTILTLTSPEIIQHNKDYNYSCIQKLINSAYNLSMIFKIIYDEEREILLLINSMVINSIKLYRNDDVSIVEKLNADSKRLLHLYTAYDTANWEFIKGQSKGYLWDDNEFLRYYNKYKPKFDRLNQYSDNFNSDDQDIE